MELLKNMADTLTEYKKSVAHILSDEPVPLLVTGAFAYTQGTLPGGLMLRKASLTGTCHNRERGICGKAHRGYKHNVR